MTYDPNDNNDDGTIEADIDNQSISTESLSNNFVFASEFATSGDGSLSNPWRDGLAEAMSEFDSEDHQAVFLPPGIMDVTKRINPLNYLVEYTRDDGSNAFMPPPIIGAGKKASIIRAGSDLDNHILDYDSDDISDPGITITPVPIHGIYIDGHKSTQDSDYVAIRFDGNNRRITRPSISNVSVRWGGTPIKGVNSGGLKANIIDTDFRHNNLKAELPGKSKMFGGDISESGEAGALANAHVEFHGTSFANNEAEAIVFDGQAGEIHGGLLEQNNTNSEASNNAAIRVSSNASKTAINMPFVQDGNNDLDGVLDNQGDDTRADFPSMGLILVANDTGARSVINGVATDTAEPGTGSADFGSGYSDHVRVFWTDSDGVMRESYYDGSWNHFKPRPELLVSKSPSGTSDVQITSGIDGTYPMYELRFSKIVPATDGVNLRMQFSNDGGTGYASETSDYQWGMNRIESDGTISSSNNNSTSQIQVNGIGQGNASGEHLSGTVRIHTPNDSGTYTTTDADMVGIRANGDTVRTVGGGTYLTAETIDALKLFFSSGNISSGEIDLYGIPS